MDVNEVIERLLRAGQELARKGQSLAEKGLNLPESGPERDKVVAALGKGAAAGGILTLLLGTRAGRRISGPLINIGSLAALGLLGYTAYQNWKSETSHADDGLPIDQLTGEERNRRSNLLLRAMIAAANADGHLDATERETIASELKKLESEPLARTLRELELDAPISMQDLASQVDSMAAASEVYLMSLLVIDAQNPMERNYLDQLALAMGMPRELVQKIESQVE